MNAKGDMMKSTILIALLAVLASLTGCASQDPLTIQNMERFRKVWEEDRRADLPQEKIEAREFEFDQALRYEKSK